MTDFSSRSPLNERLLLITRWVGVFVPVGIVAGPSYADIFCSMTAVLFLVYALWTQDFSWARQSWFLISAAYWLYLIVRALSSDNEPESLAFVLPFIRYPVFAAALQHVVLRERIWSDRLAIVIIAATTALALDALLQFFTGSDVIGREPWPNRLLAFYHHPWVGWVISALFLPATCALLDRRHYLLAGLYGAVCLITIFLSGDRMALLMSLFALGLMGLLHPPARRLALIGAPAVALTFASFLFLNPSLYERHIRSTSEILERFPTSHYGVIWTSAIEMSKAHPLFGVGPRGFRDHCADPVYGPLTPYQASEPRCATHPHNVYLEALVAGGFVGLLLFLSMLVAIGRRLVKNLGQGVGSWLLVGLIATFLGRMFPLASATSFQHAWYAVPLWLVIGWGLARLHSSSAMPRHRYQLLASA